MKFQILQVKRLFTREYGFMGMQEYRKTHGTEAVFLPNYFVAFEGTTEDVGAGDFDDSLPVTAMLNNLWCIFNADDRPNGDTMHSLSVSDIVYICDTHYYCNNMGWVCVEAFGVPSSEDTTKNYRLERV